MIVPKQHILTVIPQRPPFVLIDELLYCDDERTKSTFLIPSNHILIDGNEFTEAGLVENIAQTAAAGAGYTASRIAQPVLTGYIGAIKNLEVFALPKPGDLLETEVAIETKVFEVSLIAGNVYCKGALLAACKMKIFLQPAILN